MIEKTEQRYGAYCREMAEILVDAVGVLDDSGFTRAVRETAMGLQQRLTSLERDLSRASLQ